MRPYLAFCKRPILDVTLDSSMTFDTQVTATVRACNFHLEALWQLRANRLVMLHGVSLVPSLVRGWTIVTLYYGMSNTIFKGYRWCRTLHDAVILVKNANGQSLQISQKSWQFCNSIYRTFGQYMSAKKTNIYFAYHPVVPLGRKVERNELVSIVMLKTCFICTMFFVVFKTFFLCFFCVF